MTDNKRSQIVISDAFSGFGKSAVPTEWGT